MKPLNIYPGLASLRWRFSTQKLCKLSGLEHWIVKRRFSKKSRAVSSRFLWTWMAFEGVQSSCCLGVPLFWLMADDQGHQALIPRLAWRFLGHPGEGGGPPTFTQASRKPRRLQRLGCQRRAAKRISPGAKGFGGKWLRFAGKMEEKRVKVLKHEPVLAMQPERAQFLKFSGGLPFSISFRGNSANLINSALRARSTGSKSPSNNSFQKGLQIWTRQDLPPSRRKVKTKPALNLGCQLTFCVVRAQRSDQKDANRVPSF